LRDCCRIFYTSVALRNLDLVINPDWRWFLEGETNPWYPSARLFRQDRSRLWENVVARVQGAVHEFAHSPSPPSLSGPT
jgi:hypothetical protein